MWTDCNFRVPTALRSAQANVIVESMQDRSSTQALIKYGKSFVFRKACSLLARNFVR